MYVGGVRPILVLENIMWAELSVSHFSMQPRKWAQKIISKEFSNTFSECVIMAKK